MKARIGDYIIEGIIVALALCIWLFGTAGAQGRFAVICVDGELVRSLDLRGDSSCMISGMDIWVRDGKVFVIDAQCPDMTCVKTGKISKPGQTIVCIPNRVSIEIAGVSDVDAIAGG